MLARYMLALVLAATSAGATAVVQQPVEIWSDGTRLAGDIWKPEGLARDVKVPAILLVHGWGGVKAHLNTAYAPQFAELGYIVLSFDYRGWGESDGKFVRVGEKPEGTEFPLKVREVREIVDPLGQLEDIRNALAWLVGEPQVDPERLAIWGSSLGGGLALQTAAQHSGFKVLISQIGAVDNLANWAARDPDSEPIRSAWQYQIERARGEVLPFPQPDSAVPGLRGAPDYDSMLRYDPMAWADRLNAATLIIDAESEELFDTRVNGRALYERIRNRVPASYHELPGKHYDLYQGASYEKALALEKEWLLEHLPPERR